MKYTSTGTSFHSGGVQTLNFDKTVWSDDVTSAGVTSCVIFALFHLLLYTSISGGCIRILLSAF